MNRTLFQPDGTPGTALITGASSGIGAALAERFAQAKHPLVLSARRVEKLEELAGKLRSKHGITVTVIPADLSQPEGIAKLIEQIATVNITIDILVNNAGLGVYKRFAETNWEHQRTMLHVNMLALTELTHRFLPGMLQRGHGQILNISSVAAYLPGPMMACYYATKAYVSSFSESLSIELHGGGVAVTTICPGPTTSEFASTSSMDQTGMFEGPHVLTSDQVADDAYTSCLKGRRVRIPGFLTRWMMRLAGWLPRFIVIAIVKNAQIKRSKEPEA